MEELIVTIYDHISSASIGNVLKLRQKFAFKDGEGGYDVEEFCDRFNDYCVSRIYTDDPFLIGKLITTVLEFKIDLTQNGRKDSKFDILLLDLRRIFKDWEEYQLRKGENK